MKLDIGTRIVIGGTHPWSGYIGVIIRFEQTMFGKRPVARLLELDHEVFLMNSSDIKKKID